METLLYGDVGDKTDKLADSEKRGLTGVSRTSVKMVRMDGESTRKRQETMGKT